MASMPKMTCQLGTREVKKPLSKSEQLMADYEALKSALPTHCAQG